MVRKWCLNSAKWCSNGARILAVLVEHSKDVLMASISTKQLNALARAPGKSLSKTLAHGHGSLLFRAQKTGTVSAIYRYIDQGKRHSVPIGTFDESGTKGLTLSQINLKAYELSKQHATGVTAIREKIEQESQKRNQALRRATKWTFGELLMSYEEALKAEGKTSARQVHNIFEKWVRAPFPHLLSKAANKIHRDDIMAILTFTVQANVERTVNKLRSYLAAAFQRAISAESDPSLAVSIGAGYGIETNPVMATIRVARFDKARERVLTEAELAHYLNEIEKNESVQSIALRLGIRLGGQRIEQLVRVPPQAVDIANNQITLLDPKGRRQAPRKHILPIPEQAKPLLEKLLELNKDKQYLFCNVKEDSHTSASELSSIVKKIGQGNYCLGDIRRTVETNLAALGVHKDYRAQLQSHGLSGVQDRHYDKHSYMPEKHEALKLWNAHLDTVKRSVAPYLSSSFDF
jgi:integrase